MKTLSKAANRGSGFVGQNYNALGWTTVNGDRRPSRTILGAPAHMV